MQSVLVLALEGYAGAVHFGQACGSDYDRKAECQAVLPIDFLLHARRFRIAFRS